MISINDPQVIVDIFLSTDNTSEYYIDTVSTKLHQISTYALNNYGITFKSFNSKQLNYIFNGINGQILMFFWKDLIQSSQDYELYLEQLSRRITVDCLGHYELRELHRCLKLYQEYKSLRSKKLITKIINKPLKKSNCKNIGYYTVYLAALVKQYNLLRKYESHKTNWVRYCVIKQYLKSEDMNLINRGLKLLKNNINLKITKYDSIRELIGSAILTKWKHENDRNS